MTLTDNEKLQNLFSPLPVPKLTDNKKKICLSLADQVYPERNDLMISHEEKMKRMLDVHYFKKALGKKIFNILRESLKGKILEKQKVGVTRKPLPALT